ncbi:HAD family hydrolase [Natrialbaceae archaeon A-arb3/5]
MSAAIDTVCFDLDETLCTYTQSGEVILETAFDRAGLDPCWTIEDYYDRYRDYLEESTDADSLRRQCFADLAVDAGHDREVGRTVAETYGVVREPDNVEPLPGAVDTLDRLSGEYRLGLITNGAPELQRSKIEALGLADRFETIVYAGYDAPPKPSPEPFEVALESLGTTPERAVYVGNSVSADVAGAAAAGIRSVWIPADDAGSTAPDPTPDVTIDSLAEIPQLSW